MIVTHARPADAIPQLSGRDAPGGSVLYTCSGANEHGKTCGKLLCVWLSPPTPGAGWAAQGEHLMAVTEADHGRIEIKCRRCKTLNTIPLVADPD